VGIGPDHRQVADKQAHEDQGFNGRDGLEQPYAREKGRDVEAVNVDGEQGDGQDGLAGHRRGKLLIQQVVVVSSGQPCDTGELPPGKKEKDQDGGNEIDQGGQRRKVGLLRRLVGSVDQQGHDKVDEVSEHGVNGPGGMASRGWCACLAAGQGRLFLGLAIVAVFLAVNTSAVLLPVHAQSPGFVNACFPSVAEILVEKGHPHGFSHGLTDGADLVVFLKAAVQQGGGKSVEFALLGEIGRGGQAVMVATGAALGLAKGHTAQKSFDIVAWLINHFQADGFRIATQGLFPPHALGKGMNVVAVEKPHDLMVVVSQHL
jgi:hypothetical protein